MSDIDISLLRRIVEPALASQPELLNQVAPILTAADGDGVPNEEDNTLGEEEARSYLQHARQETERGLTLLTQNRESLVGSLQTAIRRVRNAGGSEALTNFMTLAAQQDPQPEELSAEEVEMLIASLQSDQEHQSDMTVASFMRDTRELLRQVRVLEASTPEAFVPTTEAEQRSTIDLNFLKDVPPTQFEGDGEQAQLMVLLLSHGGVDPSVRDGEWDISYEDMQHLYEQAPASQRSQLPPIETMMANLRFIARHVREQVNAGLGLAAQEGDAASINLAPLIERREALAGNPMVDLLIDNAGDDGVLTILEARQLIARLRETNPHFSADAQVFMAGARRLVESLTTASPEELAEAQSTPQLTREEFLNQLVLQDLREMQEGFTHRDEQYIREDSLTNFVNGVLWFCQGAVTLTSYHTVFDGPTYGDLLEESVAGHDTERGTARQTLERLVTTPDPEFMHWLQGRPEGERMVTIPNALEFLRTHDDQNLPGRNRRYYELLTGPLFQANRLWELHNMADPHAQGEAWLAFAQELRSGYFLGWSDQSHLDLISNFEFSRTILNSLTRESTDPADRHAARHALEDSIGINITDDEGHTLTQGGGELGLNPFNWFRNYSDENRDGAWSDAILLVATWWMGGELFKGFTSLTSAGRAGLSRLGSVLTFFGLRGAESAAPVVAEGAASSVVAGGETLAAQPNGVYRWIFDRMFGNWIRRRVLAAETELAVAQEGLTAARTGGQLTEIRAAQEAVTQAEEGLARAQGVHQVMTSPISIPRQVMAAAAERAAPHLDPVVSRFTQRLASLPVNMENPLVRFAFAGASYGWTASRFVARQTGRFLSYLSYEGIMTYAIAGLIFQEITRHQEHWTDYDRQYFLELPEETEDSSEDSGDSGVASDPSSARPSSTEVADGGDPSPAPRGIVEDDE